MRLAWKIFSTLILVLVFISLSIFSSVEYRPDKVEMNNTNDKLPLAKKTFTSLSYLIAYLEKMPTIRLLPVVTKSVDYQRQVLDNIDQKQVDYLIDKSNIKEEIPILKSENRADIRANLNLESLFNRLKDRLSKDWFQS